MKDRSTLRVVERGRAVEGAQEEGKKTTDR